MNDDTPVQTPPTGLITPADFTTFMRNYQDMVFSPGSHIRIRADLLPALALYGALMWKLKGSTVGGIVCGLKVVRLDDRPIDWGTAIVRALSCFLSLFVMGFGFIWIVFDDQRQSWHDKIAGTVVVRAPRGESLV